MTGKNMMRRPIKIGIIFKFLFRRSAGFQAPTTLPRGFTASALWPKRLALLFLNAFSPLLIFFDFVALRVIVIVLYNAK